MLISLKGRSFACQHYLQTVVETSLHFKEYHGHTCDATRISIWKKTCRHYGDWARESSTAHDWGPAPERQIEALSSLAMRKFLEAKQPDDLRRDIASKLQLSDGPFFPGDKVYYWTADKSK